MIHASMRLRSHSRSSSGCKKKTCSSIASFLMHPCSVKVCMPAVPSGQQKKSRYQCNDRFVDSVLFSGCNGVVEAHICNPPGKAARRRSCRV